MTLLIRNVHLLKIVVRIQALQTKQCQVAENFSRPWEPGCKWCFETVTQGHLKPPLNLSGVPKH